MGGWLWPPPAEQRPAGLQQGSSRAPITAPGANAMGVSRPQPPRAMGRNWVSAARWMGPGCQRSGRKRRGQGCAGGSPPRHPLPLCRLPPALVPLSLHGALGTGKCTGVLGGRAPPPLPPDTSGSLHPCWHGRSFLPALSPPPFFRDRFGARSCSLEPRGCSQPPDAAVSKTRVGAWRVWVPPHPHAPLHVASVTCSIASVLLCRKQLCSLPAQQRHGGNQVGKSGGRSSPPACLSSRGTEEAGAGRGWGAASPGAGGGTLPAWAVPRVLLPWSGCAGRGPTLHPSSGSLLSSLHPTWGWQCQQSPGAAGSPSPNACLKA